METRDAEAVITGGARRDGDFRSWLPRDAWPSFERSDGALFCFTLSFSGKKRSMHLIASSYTLQLPRKPDLGIAALRWDINRTGPMHEADGLRSHLHVHKDVRLPFTELAVIEMLDLLVYRAG